MTVGPPQARATSRGRTALDRVEAAHLLRRACVAARAGGADEAVDWAFSALPDSPAARRLKIQMLLRQDNLEAAEALVAQGLLLRPTDASLSLLRARCLFARRRFQTAARELHLVLAKRPTHCAALELAGRVALGQGQTRRAVQYFQQVERRHPDDRIKGELVSALLDDGRPLLARRVLRRMETPSALLRAAVLRAEGRLLEARETLEDACADTAAPEHATLMGALIEVLEEASDLQRLRRVLERVDIDRPTVLALAGRSWLAMGAFHTAAVSMSRLARVPGFRAPALVVLMIAATMIGRPRLARRALTRIRRLDEPIDCEIVAEAWTRGLLGRLLLDQCSTRKAGADPHTGHLQQLLAEAEGVLEEVLAAGRDRLLSRPERRELQQHLAVCRQMAARTEDDAPGVALAA